MDSSFAQKVGPFSPQIHYGWPEEGDEYYAPNGRQSR